MVITKEFLLSEIGRFEADVAQARAFIVSAETAISAYKALVARMDAPEPTPEVAPIGEPPCAQ